MGCLDHSRAAVGIPLTIAVIFSAPCFLTIKFAPPRANTKSAHRPSAPPSAHQAKKSRTPRSGPFVQQNCNELKVNPRAGLPFQALQGLFRGGDQGLAAGFGLAKRMATVSTAVRIIRKSASRSSAKSSEAKFLSMTAATPSMSSSLTCTGIPPPPAQITRWPPGS